MTSSIKYQTVLFDLDGTLIDHFRCIYRCYRYALEKMGLEPVDYETVKASVGGAVIVTMGRLIGEDRAEEGVHYFREHFREIMLEDIVVFEGVDWVLAALKEQGIQTACFTNKDADGARSVLAHVGLSDKLDAIFGTNELPWRKPMPKFTQYVLEQLEARPDTTLMIGDSPFDVAAAKTFNIDCHCVTTGSHDRDGLMSESPAPDGVWPNMLALASGCFGLEPRPR